MNNNDEIEKDKKERGKKGKDRQRCSERSYAMNVLAQGSGGIEDATCHRDLETAGGSPSFSCSNFPRAESVLIYSVLTNLLILFISIYPYYFILTVFSAWFGTRKTISLEGKNTRLHPALVRARAHNPTMTTRMALHPDPRSRRPVGILVTVIRRDARARD